MTGIWAPTPPSNSPRPLRDPGHRTDTLAPRRGVLLLTDPDPAPTPALGPSALGERVFSPAILSLWLGSLYVPGHLDNSPGYSLPSSSHLFSSKKPLTGPLLLPFP